MEEKKREENNWRREIFFVEYKKAEKEIEDSILRRKIFFCGGEGKGGKYLEKEN